MKPEKNYNVFEIDGTIFLENHEKGSYHIGEVDCVDINCLNDIASELNALNDENEQLKQFKEDVFNKIDMHLRMLPTARDNEFNEENGDPSLYIGAIYMLETLKKELEE